MKIDWLRRALHAREPVRDEDFDEIFPLAYRTVSARYWTPVRTARRAADLLVAEGARRILDIGAGVGKFCLVGAASTERAEFVGVEHRAHLVEVAHEAARQLGTSRVEIMHSRFDEAMRSGALSFDGLYLYNPFAENLFARDGALDGTVHLSGGRFDANVARATAVFAAAPPGTPVVTYYGYGGTMPPDYVLVHAERQHAGGALHLWIKNGALADRAPAGRKRSA